MSDKRISVAPMMGMTDRHFRFMASLLCDKVSLYTPMIHVDAINQSDKNFLQKENKDSKAVGIQIAGNDPVAVSHASKVIKNCNYNEINLNIGCPSERVQNCKVGAALMDEPKTVGEMVESISHTCDLPVTIKTRLGIDDLDSYEFLCEFIETTSKYGCKHYILHARKALLSGLSPKENRTIPPINYSRVYKIKEQFSDLTIEINGEIKNTSEIKEHFKYVDGVMIGREACNNPLFLREISSSVYGDIPMEMTDFFEKMFEYILKESDSGTGIHFITRHMTSLFKGMPGAKEWRNLAGGIESKKISTEDLVRSMKLFVEDKVTQH